MNKEFSKHTVEVRGVQNKKKATKIGNKKKKWVAKLKKDGEDEPIKVQVKIEAPSKSTLEGLIGSTELETKKEVQIGTNQTKLDDHAED